MDVEDVFFGTIIVIIFLLFIVGIICIATSNNEIAETSTCTIISKDIVKVEDGYKFKLKIKGLNTDEKEIEKDVYTHPDKYYELKVGDDYRE